MDPTGTAVDTNGNVYVVDFVSSTIQKITPAGVVTTLAGLAGSTGSADGTGTNALFNHPDGLTVDTNGNVFVADTSNHTIRKVTPAGMVTTLAGQAGNPGSTNATGTNAQFYNPTSVAVDTNGNVYVADVSNSLIRKVTPAGVVTTLAGQGGQSRQHERHGDERTVYVSLWRDSRQRGECLCSRHIQLHDPQSDAGSNGDDFGRTCRHFRQYRRDREHRAI